MAVSTKPYIGSRDFYPEEMKFRNWMFGVQRQICRQYGYEEYAAPIMEPLSLYQAKSSEEIVGEQIYTFKDRGDRDVAIRPEMTPTLARMVAAKGQNIPRPIRYFSIANFMRYERPGKGRLREFYQLNVDLMGSSSPAADAEIIMLAVDLMKEYGATNGDFRVRFSDRRLLDSYLKKYNDLDLRALGRLLDKKDKIDEEKYREELKEICSDEACMDHVNAFLDLTMKDLGEMVERGELERDAAEHLLVVNDLLVKGGYGESLDFDPGIVRGFDYYTGLIFEIYDNDPENRRALFGGGRYDKLLGLFGNEEIPAVGFGMGDVTLENFIDSHGLKPDHLNRPEGVFLTLFNESMLEENIRLAGELRRAGVPLEMSFEAKGKFGKQLQLAEKKGARYVLIMGEEELQNGVIRVKDLASGEQSDISRTNLEEFAGQLRDPMPAAEVG